MAQVNPLYQIYLQTEAVVFPANDRIPPPSPLCLGKRNIRSDQEQRHGTAGGGAGLLRPARGQRPHTQILPRSPPRAPRTSPGPTLFRSLRQPKWASVFPSIPCTTPISGRNPGHQALSSMPRALRGCSFPKLMKLHLSRAKSVSDPSMNNRSHVSREYSQCPSTTSVPFEQHSKAPAFATPRK